MMRYFLVVLLLFIWCGKGEFEKKKGEALEAKKKAQYRAYLSQAQSELFAGNHRKAINLYQKAWAIDTSEAVVVYNMACAYSLLNKKDSAVIWLRKSIDMGMYGFTRDADFDNIKSTKEYRELDRICDSLIQEIEDKELKPVIHYPEDYQPEETYPLIIALHGYGHNPEKFSKNLHKVFTDRGYIFVAPYAPEVLGKVSFSWGGPDDAEKRIKEAFAEVEDKIDPENVILLGYSQGGYIAFSVGIKNPDIFNAIITVAGAFSHREVKDYLPKLANRDFKAYIIVGAEDSERLIKSCELAKEELENVGAWVHLEIYPELGHAFPADYRKSMSKALDWLAKEVYRGKAELK